MASEGKTEWLSKGKGLLIASYMIVKIIATHQCMKIGPREQAQLQIIKDNMESVTTVRGDYKVVLVFYGTSPKKHK